MSRIGMMPIEVPSGVTVKIDGMNVNVKGQKGTLSWSLSAPITAKLEGNEVIVSRPDDTKLAKSRHGLSRTLIANMVEGVSKGFSKTLEIRGTGYKARVEGKQLILNVGFCHSVDITPPENISFEAKQRGDFTLVIVSGIDKQAVGEVTAQIRRVRPPEPYKGKGIRYDGEWVRQKAGKTGVA